MNRNGVTGMGEPLISIIVPVYNAENYLRKCVASICAQTYQNLEILLIDDGSSDGSGALCETLALDDPRILVIHKENGGAASARNAGLDAMHGDYVGFVDADDWIAPEMYEILLQRMIVENAQISCCGAAIVEGEAITGYFNANLNDHITVGGTDAQLELIHNSRITNVLWDKLYAAEIFDGLRQKTDAYMDDLAVQHLCIAKAARVTYTAQPFYYWYQSENSVTRGHFSLRFFEWITSTEERLAFYQEHFPACVPEAYNQYISLCMDMLLITEKKPEWKENNKELVRKISAPLLGNYGDDMGRITKLKRLLVKIHPKLFVQFCGAVEKLESMQAKIGRK